RVSTRQQQRSGLGIEAQRSAVTRFAEAEGMTIIAEFVEAETGKGADALDRRPQLAAALAAARAGSEESQRRETRQSSQHSPRRPTRPHHSDCGCRPLCCEPSPGSARPSV